MNCYADRLLALIGSLCVHGIAIAAIVAYASGDAKDAPPSPKVIALALEWEVAPSGSGATSDAETSKTESASHADAPAVESVQSVPMIKTTGQAEDPAPAVELASAPQDIRPSQPKPAIAVRAKPTPPNPAKEAVQTDTPMASLSELTTLAAQNMSAIGDGLSNASSPGPNADRPRSWSIISRPAPTYPMTARRRGSEGEVVLQVDVDQDGRPRRVAILRSSGDPQLDGAAALAIEQWRFAVAAPMAIEIPIQFRLRPDTLAANQP